MVLLEETESRMGSCPDLGEKQGRGDYCLIDTEFQFAAAAPAKLLQSCPTLCDPIDAARQAPVSLGFSRQEHWSGLPFPPPMHVSV